MSNNSSIQIQLTWESNVITSQPLGPFSTREFPRRSHPRVVPLILKIPPPPPDVLPCIFKTFLFRQFVFTKILKEEKYQYPNACAGRAASCGDWAAGPAEDRWWNCMQSGGYTKAIKTARRSGCSERYLWCMEIGKQIKTEENVGEGKHKMEIYFKTKKPIDRTGWSIGVRDFLYELQSNDAPLSVIRRIDRESLHRFQIGGRLKSFRIDEQKWLFHALGQFRLVSKRPHPGIHGQSDPANNFSWKQLILVTWKPTHLKRLSAFNVRKTVVEPNEWPAMVGELNSITPCDFY